MRMRTVFPAAALVAACALLGWPAYTAAEAQPANGKADTHL
jgi:hypothetical protein